MKRICLLIIILYMSYLYASERPKVALVLSGGGARAFAQIGMLKVIDELGIEIDYVIGTSMGAVIGGLYASGKTPDEIEAILVSIDWEEMLLNSLERGELHTSRKKWLPTGNYYFTLNEHFLPEVPQGMVPANDIHLRLFRETWDVAHITDFEELPISFKAVTTDLLTGNMYLYERGGISDAMRASSSIPSLFLPFDIDDMLLIDGGLSQNFPADIADSLGADIIIGLKTNTELLGREELTNYFKVLNQTLNIGMLHIQNEAEKYADLIIAQNKQNFTNTDFHRVAEIIQAGYDEAMQYREELLAIVDSLSIYEKKEKTVSRLHQKIKFSTIAVTGNNYLTDTMIKNYIGVNTTDFYDKEALYRAFKNAYSTELFDQIYPEILQNGDTYSLVIKVKERERKHLGINISYNQQDDFVVGAILRMKNIFLKNSNMLVHGQFGGKQALELDYSKYIYSDHTVYYRLFPYFKSENLYNYNEKYEKTSKHKIDEAGLTAGLGYHFIKNTMVEPYVFTYQLQYKGNIGAAPADTTKFISTGVGVKLYYENLDEYPYYMKGVQVFSKWTTARNETFENQPYSKMLSTATYAQPLHRRLSLIVGGEYGTFFKSDFINHDPFYFGGIDHFMGLYPKEQTAPIYRMASVGLRLKTRHNFVIDLKSNAINYGSEDKWPLMDDSKYGLGLVVGYNTFFGPLRIGWAVNNNKDYFGYVSVGFDYDPFMLSRR